MDWQPRQDKPGIQHTEEGYQVTPVRTQGRLRFVAWPPKPPQDRGRAWQERLHTAIGYFNSQDAARRACEEHHAKNRSAP